MQVCLAVRSQAFGLLFFPTQAILIILLTNTKVQFMYGYLPDANREVPPDIPRVSPVPSRQKFRVAKQDCEVL